MSAVVYLGGWLVLLAGWFLAAYLDISRRVAFPPLYWMLGWFTGSVSVLLWSAAWETIR